MQLKLASENVYVVDLSSLIISKNAFVFSPKIRGLTVRLGDQGPLYLVKIIPFFFHNKKLSILCRLYLVICGINI